MWVTSSKYSDAERLVLCLCEWRHQNTLTLKDLYFVYVSDVIKIQWRWKTCTLFMWVTSSKYSDAERLVLCLCEWLHQNTVTLKDLYFVYVSDVIKIHWRWKTCTLFMWVTSSKYSDAERLVLCLCEWHHQNTVTLKDLYFVCVNDVIKIQWRWKTCTLFVWMTSSKYSDAERLLLCLCEWRHQNTVTLKDLYFVYVSDVIKIRWRWKTFTLFMWVTSSKYSDTERLVLCLCEWRHQNTVTLTFTLFVWVTSSKYSDADFYFVCVSDVIKIQWRWKTCTLFMWVTSSKYSDAERLVLCLCEWRHQNTLTLKDLYFVYVSDVIKIQWRWKTCTLFMWVTLSKYSDAERLVLCLCECRHQNTVTLKDFYFVYVSDVIKIQRRWKTFTLFVWVTSSKYSDAERLVLCLCEWRHQKYIDAERLLLCLCEWRHQNTATLKDLYFVYVSDVIKIQRRWKTCTLFMWVTSSKYSDAERLFLCLCEWRHQNTVTLTFTLFMWVTS